MSPLHLAKCHFGLCVRPSITLCVLLTVRGYCICELTRSYPAGTAIFWPPYNCFCHHMVIIILPYFCQCSMTLTEIPLGLCKCSTQHRGIWSLLCHHWTTPKCDHWHDLQTATFKLTIPQKVRFREIFLENKKNPHEAKHKCLISINNTVICLRLVIV